MIKVWTDAAEAGLLERIEEDSVNHPTSAKCLTVF